MKLDDFKLKSEAEDSYHLVHPSGKTFTVEKKGLNKKALEKIKKMSCGGSVQKFADGGDVLPAPIRPGPGMSSDADAPQDYRYTPDQTDMIRDTFSQITPNAIEPVDPAQVALNADRDAHAVSGIGVQPAQLQAVGASGSWESPVSVTPSTVSAQTMPAQAQGVDPMAASFDKSEGAIKDYLKQTGAASGQAMAAQSDLIKQLQAQKTPDQIFQENKAKDDQLMQHYMDQKIDPNRYLASKSTGSRILSAIGIALSGLGAGANGKNLAIEGINKAIENDISAQQSEQGKAMNLFKMNREQTQSEQQAHLMTTNQLLTGVQAKIAMAAAQSQNADVKLRGQMMLQQVEQQKVENNRKMAYMQAGPNVDPALLVQNSPMSAAATPAMKEKALSEIEAHQNTVKSRDQILAAFDRAAKANHLKDYIPGTSNADQKALHALMGPTFVDVEGTVRQAAMDNMNYNTTPNPLSDTSSEIDTKRKALIGYLDSKGSAPNFKATTGMDLNQFASTSSNPMLRMSPQNQRIYQIAMANPGPAADLALKKLGVK